MNYLISYDSEHENSSTRLISRIKTLNACTLHRYSWLVSSTLTASEIRDMLESAIDDTDALFVIEISNQWASCYAPLGASHWLDKNFQYSSTNGIISPHESEMTYSR